MLPVTVTTILPPVASAVTWQPTAAPFITVEHIAPSVSSARPDNNARGNASYVATPPKQAVVETSVPSLASMPSPLPATPLARYPSEFLSQWLGQDDAAITQKLLAEYERLISYGDVKYKPSNASKPLPAPSNLFGKLLREEKIRHVALAMPVAAPDATPDAADTQIEEESPAMAADHVAAGQVEAGAPPSSPLPDETAQQVAPQSMASMIAPLPQIEAYHDAARRAVADVAEHVLESA